MVNEILDYSKIEAGKLRIEHAATSLSEVINHAVDLVAEHARSKHLEFQVNMGTNLPANCVSDPLHLGQILLNLLSNAVKFTETGKVTLAASLDGQELVFVVTDTGIGMNAEQLRHLFSPFEQGDGSTTRRFGGTGLGLAICKRTVELMGGKISADSVSGQGSRFEFRLPYIPADVTDTALGTTRPESYPNQPLTGVSVLLVEDEVIAQLVLETNLTDDGAKVTTAGNGREALETLVREGAGAYDIVLMDVEMPEMDGFEATARMLEIAPGLPIIGQTAHAFLDERDKCLAAGMVDQITKPIDPDLLVRVVLKHASARHPADA